jgi:hypothetical protein
MPPVCAPYEGCAKHWPNCHQCGKPSLDEKGVPGLFVDSFDRKDKKDHDKLVCRACHPALGHPNYKWPRL